MSAIDNLRDTRRRAPALDVAVVGGGMVGAAAALTLARAGFSTALLDAREPTPWQPADVDLRVVGLAPSSVSLLDSLGVWAPIRDARASAYRHMHVWDAESGAAIDFDAASEGRDALGYIVENPLIQWTLWQALEAAGVQRLCPADVVGFEAREDRITLQLGHDGDRKKGTASGRPEERTPSGGRSPLAGDAPALDLHRESEQEHRPQAGSYDRERLLRDDRNDSPYRDERTSILRGNGQNPSHLTARLLVAADGGGSPLRQLAGIATRDRDYGQRAVVAHLTTERAHAHTAWQRFLPGGPLALLPLADGRSSMVWSLPEAEAQRVLELDDAAFLEAVGVASDFRLGRVTATTRRAAFPLRLQLAQRYQAERMVLLGDAAHTVHPLAGQGVNLGLRDVAELRDTLIAARAAGADIGASHVLRRYARRRRSADTLDALGFDALSRLYAWQSPALVAARGFGVRLLDRIAPLKRRISGHAGRG